MGAQTNTKPVLLSTGTSSQTSNYLLRAAGIMGLLTSASRVLGFLRDLLLAAFYGTSTIAQAFVVAFRIPNLLRDLLGEGAANAAFVPVFTSVRAKEGEESFRRLTQAVWVRVLVTFVLVSLAGILLSPWLVRLIAPGFVSDPSLFELTVRLTRIVFPFIGLMGVAAFFMGLLNSLNHFSSPSLGPVMLNITMISGILLFRTDALGLAWGVVLGGFIQMAVQLPALRRNGIRLGFRWLHHPGVHQIRTLLIPRIIGTGVYQAGVLIDTIFASFSHFVQSGGVASLYFAHRFLHLPLALFGISVAQAALPRMANFVATNDLKEMKRTCILSLRSSLFIAIPSSVGLMVLAHPIIRTLLEHGAFSAEATQMTSVPLRCYAVGLASLCAVKVLANTLYALHDTWTPVRSAAISLGLNLVLNILLIQSMGLAGLALATSVSSTWNGYQLFRAVEKRIGDFPKSLRLWGISVTLASVAMGAVAFSIWTMGGRMMDMTLEWTAPLLLLVSVMTGILSFFLFGRLFQVEETSQLFRWLWRRR